MTTPRSATLSTMVVQLARAIAHRRIWLSDAEHAIVKASKGESMLIIQTVPMSFDQSNDRLAGIRPEHMNRVQVTPLTGETLAATCGISA